MYKKRSIKQTAESKEKSRFRQSAKWKKFRAYLKKEADGCDIITGKKLLKGFQVHHKDMRLENYKDVSDPARFIAVNKQTHEVIHWLYRYYEKDPFVIDCLKTVLEEMKTYNNDINNNT